MELFLFFATAIMAAVYRYARRKFFRLPRYRPRSWAVVGGNLSCAQRLSASHRVPCLFERYRPLLQSTWLLVLFSALTFAYMHLVFRNWIAVALAALRGLLFAMRYAQTGSLFVSCFEHSLYRCWLFTVGLGRWFLSGTVPV